MNVRQLVALSLVFGLQPLASGAADYSDRTWPCIQRKVERLSAGLMWPAPLEETQLDAGTASAVAELAERLSLRRIEIDSLRPEVEAFASDHRADLAVMGQVFERVFHGLSKRRTRIIEGIGDFSLSQIGLAEQIQQTRDEIDRLTKSKDPDFDRIDRLEEQQDWDQTIYSDRQQSITYLCETPVLIEKRLFAIAQLLASAAVEGG